MWGAFEFFCFSKYGSFRIWYSSGMERHWNCIHAGVRGSWGAFQLNQSMDWIYSHGRDVYIISYILRIICKNMWMTKCQSCPLFNFKYHCMHIIYMVVGSCRSLPICRLCPWHSRPKEKYALPDDSIHCWLAVHRTGAELFHGIVWQICYRCVVYRLPNTYKRDDSQQ